MSHQLRIDLWPPSANSIWRNIQGRTLLSKSARHFYRHAPWMVKSQAPGVHYEIAQPVEVRLTLRPPSKRAYDIDNRAKATLDALVKAGILADDRQVSRLILEKGLPIDGGQVLVEITNYASEKEPGTGQRACR